VHVSRVWHNAPAVTTLTVYTYWEDLGTDRLEECVVLCRRCAEAARIRSSDRSAVVLATAACHEPYTQTGIREPPDRHGD
jgi:hypothetical protein